MAMVTRYEIRGEVGRVCCVPACGRSLKAKGFCQNHYRRSLAHGDPLGGRTENGTAVKFYKEALTYEGDECLKWPFGNDGKGRGTVWKRGKTCRVSRLVCEDIHGAPPTLEHDAAHSCGKGHLGCITKRHLSWKTKSENQADRISHGTHDRGERSHHAKLTEFQVREILNLKGVETQENIASRYGVQRQHISQIQTGKRWRHVQ